MVDFPNKQQDGRRDHPHHLLREGAHPFRRLEMPRDPTGRRWPKASFLPGTCKALGDPVGWQKAAGMQGDVQGSCPALGATEGEKLI